MIKHYPNLNIKDIEKHYTEKDGVPIKYVCTSSINPDTTYAYDIFYREDPHPKFGNRYFGIIAFDKKAYITNADRIEDFDFYMLVDEDGDYYYSQHRHHFIKIKDDYIDGGRAYVHYNNPTKIVYMKMKNGEFVIENITDQNERNLQSSKT